MSIFAYNNRALKSGQFTGTVGAWATTPAIENMATAQVPTPHARVTPDAGAIAFTYEAQDSGGDPENMTVDVLALIAHTLPDSAVVTFLDGATELAQVTYIVGANKAAPGFVVAVLSAPVTLDTITVSIASAGSEPVRIGTFWASGSFRHMINPDDYSDVPSAFDRLSSVDAVVWPNRRARIETISAEFYDLSEPKAIGPSAENWRDITRQVGYSEPVLFMPAERLVTEVHYGLITDYSRIGPRWFNSWTGGFTLKGML